MKIIFVGSGDATNEGGRANQAIWVEDDQIRLLLDCGPTTLYRLRHLELDPATLDGIFLTHFHGDHIGGIPTLDLQLEIEGKRTAPLFYVGPGGLANQLHALQELFYSGLAQKRFARQVVELSPGKTHSFWAGHVQVTPYPMKHRPESQGYRLQIGEKILAITGDTAWNSNIPLMARDAHLLIAECSSYHPTPLIPHLSYLEIAEQLPHLHAGQIVLNHLGGETLEMRQKLEIPIADDGMVIIV